MTDEDQVLIKRGDDVTKSQCAIYVDRDGVKVEHAIILSTRRLLIGSNESAGGEVVPPGTSAMVNDCFIARIPHSRKDRIKFAAIIRKEILEAK